MLARWWRAHRARGRGAGRLASVPAAQDRLQASFELSGEVVATVQEILDEGVARGRPRASRAGACGCDTVFLPSVNTVNCALCERLTGLPCERRAVLRAGKKLLIYRIFLTICRCVGEGSSPTLSARGLKED